MNFIPFYLLGIAVAGWAGGARPATLLSLLSAAILSFEDLVQTGPPRAPWLDVWNASTRFAVMAGIGWLASELRHLTTHLGTVVEERTAQWKAEAEQHKATLARLAEAFELNQKILAASAMGVVVYKASGECVFANEALARMAGGPREEILRGNFRQLEGWRRCGLLEMAEQALTDGQPRSGEYCDTTRFGKKVWVDSHIIPFLSAGERHLLQVSIDITERKRGELLLRAQRELGVRLSLATDLDTALHDLLGVVMQLEGVDCGGVYLAAPLTGALHLAAYSGKVSETFLHRVQVYPADSDRSRDVAKGEPIYLSGAALRGGTEPVRVAEGLRAVAVLPLCHESRAVGSLNLASHTHDTIPEQSRIVMETIATQAAGAIARLRAQMELQQTQERLHTIVSSLPIAIFAVDANGILTFAEGRGMKLVGEPSEQIGRQLTECYAQYPDILKHMRRALAGEEFSASVHVGPTVFDCWYSPTREPDGTISGYIGVAVNVTERVRLQRQILEISDREQARLGQEIHDGLCQQLVSLAFDANALEHRLEQARRPEARVAERLAQYLDQAITEARQLSRGLFPVRLELDGLAAALEELARATEQRFHIRCRFECRGQVRLPGKTMATHLYRIAQESVHNALKHGHATNIVINLRATDGQIELQVDDNGTGLGTQTVAGSGGMGCHIMDYRARSMGGVFRLGSGAGGGASIYCAVPANSGTGGTNVEVST